MKHYDASAVDHWIAAKFGRPIEHPQEDHRAYSTKTVLAKLDVSRSTLLRLIEKENFPSPLGFRPVVKAQPPGRKKGTSQLTVA